MSVSVPRPFRDLNFSVTPKECDLLLGTDKTFPGVNTTFKVFVPSNDGGRLFVHFIRGTGTPKDLEYQPFDATGFQARAFDAQGGFLVPGATKPGWYRFKIESPSEDCKFMVRYVSTHCVKDPDDPTREWRPWALGWYPMANEYGCEKLYDAPGPLAKYDLATAQWTGGDYATFLAGGGTVGHGSFENQYRCCWVGDPTGKRGQRFEKKIVKESDAEQTLGMDFDNNPAQPWIKTNWQSGKTRDFVNGDGDTNDEYDGYWFGHCYANSAILCLWKKPPTTPFTFNSGGVAQQFTVLDKKGLLIALFTYDTRSAIDSPGGKHAYEPGKWYLNGIGNRLSRGNAFIGELFEPIDPARQGGESDEVWNYLVYKSVSELKQINDADLKSVEIIQTITSWTGSAPKPLRYKYSMTFAGDGKANVTSGNWGSEPLDGQDDPEHNHQRPDNCWWPEKPGTPEAPWLGTEWDGKLNFDKVKTVLEGGEPTWKY